jgi:DNA-directed RNA polymerase alpha subunit
MKPKSQIKVLLRKELLNYKNNKNGICISARLYNVLKASGIVTVGDLVGNSLTYYENLTQTKRNFGPATFNELIFFVTCLELRFGDN